MAGDKLPSDALTPFICRSATTNTRECWSWIKCVWSTTDLAIVKSNRKRIDREMHSFVCPAPLLQRVHPLPRAECRCIFVYLYPLQRGNVCQRPILFAFINRHLLPLHFERKPLLLFIPSSGTRLLHIMHSSKRDCVGSRRRRWGRRKSLYLFLGYLVVIYIVGYLR